ncbi:pimeloyl-ACP methyl ester carboxylesterase [Amycolatopsis sulphurea]|uniref:Pimeloyl-ACP methyl ester carboxylesterase n=1 Tax=Amycolatopsis sulphurea TaxID=76022 RepID=A0A2A9FA64_9PSEU|nr:pimeloyl-ACP methyl ester carboxylesterase [Amycolatopsis sulphurea]
MTPRLARRRIPAVAVDLQGQGLEGVSPSSRWSRPFDESAFATEVSGVASVTASSAAEALIDHLRLIGEGDPCVVVAHSMGGVVATLAAEQEPSLFSQLLYIAAFAPVNGLPAAADFTADENEGELGTQLLRADPFTVGASRVDSGDPDSRAAIQKALYGDVSSEIADVATSLLNSDAPVGIAAETISVSRERFGSVPHTYVMCGDDYMIRPALQRRTIRDIDAVSAAPTTVVELPSSHSPFLSQPDAVAEAIATAWGKPLSV